MSTTSISSNSIFEPSYGAHPTLVTKITVSTDSLPTSRLQTEEPGVESSKCTLFLHYALPPLLFVDSYELGMREAEYSVVDVRGTGARELEKPVHALPKRESLDVLDEGVQLVVRKDVDLEQGSFEVRLPTHVRYGEPRKSASRDGGYLVQGVEEPRVVLTCPEIPALDCPGTGQTTLPSLLQDCLSSPNYCVATPARSSLTISVPLGNTQDLPVVELGTATTILVCFLWVAWQAWNVKRRLSGQKAPAEKHKEL